MSLKFPSAIAGLDPINQGKTRDLFPAKIKTGPKVGEECLNITATDRLSTHNVVHESTIPKKGEVLTALTVFWLTQIFPAAGIPHHLLAYGKQIYDFLDGPHDAYPENLHHRSIIVEKLRVAPVEFIFRDRLGGSLWSKFYSKGLPNPYGIDLPSGLQLMSPFDEPLFTPTEKSETDEPLTTADVEKQYPAESELSRKSFVVTRDLLRSKGIAELDGKFEVGCRPDGTPVMIDEIATPDTCRFCRQDDIVLGVDPPYLDKEVARIEAMKMWGNGPKVPLTFSSDVVKHLTNTYLQIFAGITGVELDEFQCKILD